MRDYLISLRSTHKLSQQDVADMVGISRQYYNAIENGNRQKKMDITLLSRESVLTVTADEAAALLFFCGSEFSAGCFAAQPENIEAANSNKAVVTAIF